MLIIWGYEALSQQIKSAKLINKSYFFKQWLKYPKLQINYGENALNEKKRNAVNKPQTMQLQAM